MQTRWLEMKHSAEGSLRRGTGSDVVTPEPDDSGGYPLLRCRPLHPQIY